MSAIATCLKCDESFTGGLLHGAWFGVKHGTGCSPLYSTGYSFEETSDELKYTGTLDNKGVLVNAG